MRAAALLVAASLLAGCGSAQRPEAETAGADVVDCGHYENLNEPVTDDQRAADRCFAEAFDAGRPASLVVTRATVEGDPITTHLRVLPSGRIGRLVDATQDAFGGGEWHASECVGLSRGEWLEPVDCEDVPLPERLPGDG